MECKFCKTENEEGAVYCKSCGRRVDGKINCTVCGELTDAEGEYCTNCGSRPDGKRLCKCGALVDGSYCVRCGSLLPEIKYKPATKRRLDRIYAATDGATLEPWQKTLKKVAAVLAMLAVFTSVIFAFMTSVTRTLVDEGGINKLSSLLYEMLGGTGVTQESVKAAVEEGFSALEGENSVWYYFGKVYSDAAKTLNDKGAYDKSYATIIYLNAIMGTTSVGLTLIGVLVGGIIAAKSAEGVFKDNGKSFNIKAAVFTVAAFIAGALALFAIEYERVSFKLSDFNGIGKLDVLIKPGVATIVGVAIAGVAIVAAVICDVVANGGRDYSTRNVLKNVFAFCAIAFSVVVLLSVVWSEVKVSLDESGLSFGVRISPNQLGLASAEGIDTTEVAKSFDEERKRCVSGIISIIAVITALVTIPFVLSSATALFKGDEQSGKSLIWLASCALIAVVVVLVCQIVSVNSLLYSLDDAKNELINAGETGMLQIINKIKISGGIGAIIAVVAAALCVASSVVALVANKKKLA